jgi:hypothetical protein
VAAFHAGGDLSDVIAHAIHEAVLMAINSLRHFRMNRK